jgi:nucleotide-binding universal stress UspA family protein
LATRPTGCLPWPGEREADLIVVGSREHSFLDRLLGRHVDEAVAAHAGCDVLLVH